MAIIRCLTEISLRIWKPMLLTLSALLLPLSAHADNVRWPTPDWAVSPAPMTSAECQGFENFAVTSKTLATDGLVVIKDGAIQYEYYAPKYGPEQPHILWSVSKTITGALLGIAVQEGKISLDQKLADFYPLTNAPAGYDQITISDLFYMDTGFIWDEYYAGDTKNSPVLSMLYGAGRDDMAAYTATRPMIPQGPGYEWNYSTGTPVLTMGVLKKVYGADYATLPWDKLFGPLGIKNAVFERDAAGTFVGGAYAMLTPRDLARVAYLYLNNGVWEGQKILSDDWLEKTLTVSPGYLSPGTVVTNITDTGVYAGSMWLNQAVKPGLGQPYPASPSDMYLGIGHFGQFMIVLPTQHMVIARTGHDEEYNSKIDEFVSRAISCFSDPTYPIGQIIPPPKSDNPSIWQNIETLETGLRENIFEAAVAQSVCSCHYVSGVDVDTCIAQSNIPAAGAMTRTSIAADDEIDDSSSFLGTVLTLHVGVEAKAVFDITAPQYGCVLE